MRIGSKPEETPEEIPLEVQLWIHRGWTVLETERQGIVLSGPKEMRGRTKLLIVLGLILICLFYFSLMYPGVGALFVVLAVMDYKIFTKPPTKFFPAKGDKPRAVER
jgi:hypothetical protein